MSNEGEKPQGMAGKDELLLLRILLYIGHF